MKVRKTSLLLFLLLTGQGTLFASGAKENGLPLPLSHKPIKFPSQEVLSTPKESL